MINPFVNGLCLVLNYYCSQRCSSVLCHCYMENYQNISFSRFVGRFIEKQLFLRLWACIYIMCLHTIYILKETLLESKCQDCNTFSCKIIRVQTSCMFRLEQSAPRMYMQNVWTRTILHEKVLQSWHFDCKRAFLGCKLCANTSYKYTHTAYEIINIIASYPAFQFWGMGEENVLFIL